MVIRQLLASTGVAAAAGVCYALEDSLQAKELILEPPSLNWWHKGPRLALVFLLRISRK